MQDRVFIDTNILVYMYFNTDSTKAASIITLLNQHSERYISTQVINEFVNVFSKKRKIGMELIAKAVDEVTETFTVTTISVETISLALSIAIKHKYSYFDCLIVASALESNCRILYTEDMHNKHSIDNKLKIVNPFA